MKGTMGGTGDEASGHAMFKIVILIAAAVGLIARARAEDATPQRVVCLAPSHVETMIELELTNRIVGVTTGSDYLPEVAGVERVGLYVKPNTEKILSLKPDLVLATDFAPQKPVLDKLRSMGIRVAAMASDTRGIEGIFANTRETGELFGVQARSQALLERMKKVVGQTRERTQGIGRPRTYVETGYDPLFTCGKGSFIGELIEASGGANIASDIDHPYPMVSSEFILRKDPEVIILPYMGRDFGKETLKKRAGWEHISAVKTGRVHDDIGSNMITIPSPRLILYGLPELLKRIHPELAPDPNVEHRTSNTQR